MGLDISTIKGPVTLVATDENYKKLSPEEQDSLHNEAEYVFVYEGLEKRLGSLQNHAFYKGSGYGLSFRAGSYSGYNEWRDMLSRAALAVPAESVWQSPLEFEHRPFYELINFSDCEGAIGPEVCAKLAKDFANNRETVLSNVGTMFKMLAEGISAARYDLRADEEQFASRYNRWAAAFKEAGETGGFVSFH